MGAPGGFVIENGILRVYRGPGGAVRVPEGVTAVGDRAFLECRELTGIELPAGVESVGSSAFDDCGSLARVSFPAGLRRIGSSAFFGCKSLTELALPEGLERIGGSAFWCCMGLKRVSLPASLRELGDNAFAGCIHLHEVLLPPGRDVTWLIAIDGKSQLSAGCAGAMEALCAGADEDRMEALIAAAPGWPAGYQAAFYEAYLRSDTRAAMLLAETRREFDRYAALRGVDPDELRDRRLSELGLDEQGRKVYELGNRRVTARMQRDLRFLVELPDGTRTKTLPAAGADPEKLAAAETDFARLQRDAGKIWKHRADILMDDFISGRARSAADWRRTYGGNPILRGVACLLVWEQGGASFTRAEAGTVRSDGTPYPMSDAPVRVAHPMELGPGEAEAWRDYFSARGLKQPFAQIWEPVRAAAELRPDRYADCPIPYSALKGAARHGLNEKLEIPGCAVEARWRFGTAPDGSRISLCDIRRFTVLEHSRLVNHVVAWLDSVTVGDRVKKDDLSVMDWMPDFTAAQVTDFIAAAQEAGAAKVLAALLAYKNTRWPDLDPLAEFTLDW